MPSGHKFSVSVFRSALEIPSQVLHIWEKNARAANIMYPHALKWRPKEQSGVRVDPSQLWITLASAENTNEIYFVLSCTNGPLGPYPIFIFSPSSTPTVKEFVSECMTSLAKQLHQEVPHRRVYSVFAPETVSRQFAYSWRCLTGVSIESEPYYAAKYTFCTPTTLNGGSSGVMPEGMQMRLACPRDTRGVAQLCYAFADAAPPFRQSLQQSLGEARILIENNQVWVLTYPAVNTNGVDAEEIASIVAVTRESSTVSAVTKVFTNPNYRGRRCAEHLVRYVTRKLLESKEYVVLYVAHDNPSATKVYHRVGFQGLADSQESVPGVDFWLELGFDQREVDLGMW